MIHNYFHLTDELKALASEYDLMRDVLEKLGGPSTIGRYRFPIENKGFVWFWNFTWRYTGVSNGGTYIFECRVAINSHEWRLDTPSGGQWSKSEWFDEWRQLNQSFNLRKRPFRGHDPESIEKLRTWARKQA